MEIINGPIDLNLRRPLGYVPTMGALHAGHLDLVAESKKISNSTLLSIYVNPLQFSEQKDFLNYPRVIETDETAAKLAGVDYLWYPKQSDLFLDPQPKLLEVGEWGRVFEGSSRPGHFDGMLTIVARYLEILEPEYIFLGEKDWQQLRIIERYISNANLNTQVIRVKTVRNSKGLALSSRNAQLSPVGVELATVIYRALSLASTAKSCKAAKEIALREFEKTPEFKLDYLEMIDSEVMEKVSEQNLGDRLICAGWIEGIRLLDNVAVVK